MKNVVKLIKYLCVCVIHTRNQFNHIFLFRLIHIIFLARYKWGYFAVSLFFPGDSIIFIKYR